MQRLLNHVLPAHGRCVCPGLSSKWVSRHIETCEWPYQLWDGIIILCTITTMSVCLHTNLHVKSMHGTLDIHVGPNIPYLLFSHMEESIGPAMTTYHLHVQRASQSPHK